MVQFVSHERPTPDTRFALPLPPSATMAYNQQPHNYDSGSEPYDEYDYADYVEYHDQQQNPPTTQPTTHHNAPPPTTPTSSSTAYNMINNAFTAISSSLVQRISPSRARQSVLATVPEASEEGSDRQSITTTDTNSTETYNTAVETKSRRFTEHSLDEVRRISQISSDPDENPFLTPTTPTRDNRSIVYRFASDVFKEPVAGLPLPASHYSREGSYASGASRSPTPARELPLYRRVHDEEQGEDDYDDEDGDVADSLRPWSMRDTEKSSLSSGASTFDAYPTSPLPTRHFGPAPVGRVHRRHKKFKKAVRLTNGNLVVDLNVPPKLVKILPVVGGVRYEEKSEMTKTRYTAVTCDPDEFEHRGFFLRQNELGRTTELFIVITMYNVRRLAVFISTETKFDTNRKMKFCFAGRCMVSCATFHICVRAKTRGHGDKTHGKRYAYSQAASIMQCLYRNETIQVVVCIVADGRRKIHPRVLDVLTLLGVYQPGDHMKNMVNNKPVTAHMFEYTTSFGLDPNMHFKYPDKGIVPTQILFCMKEKNQKKINSHRWFFNAFGSLLQPNICVLLDVGTMPSPKSIYHLWKTFDLNSNVGGACGEIAAYKGKRWSSLINPLGNFILSPLQSFC